MVLFFGAGDEARTRYLHLGKVALYQMSYARGTLTIIADSFAFVKPYFSFFRRFWFWADSIMKLDSPDGTLAAALSGLILCSAICAEREALYERIQIQGK